MYKGGPKIVFLQSHLLFNEPPKILDIKIDLKPFKGELPMNQDLALTISEDGEGQLVNCCGYLTDREGNIVDRRGHIVFRQGALQVVRDRKGREVRA